MEKTFLITTGGSGGHVIPATILHEHLSQEMRVIISTDKRGLKYLDQDNYKIKIIDTPKLNSFFLLPLNLIKIFFLTVKSLFFLKNEKIKKIFSTGGYMSIPVILAAKILKLQIYLIEPNQILGRSNRFFLNSCKKIFCYTEKIKNFPNNLKHKMVIINPLVKKSIYELNYNNITKDKFTILIIGGSQGANIFNKKLKEFIINITKKNKIRVVQQTNESNINFLSEFYKKNNIESKIFSFDKNLYKKIQNVDLCITRAGASTLAELSLLNIPFIAVPLPSSKDNHQFENANYYKNNDCCWIINQNDFEDKVENLLLEIINNKSDFFKKKENLKRLNYQNTWISVNQKILEIINEN
tara:strand:+ start:411 stop:1475 length:1065 start_codon:yes stop_codon:yes gene_type:complete